MDKTIMDLIYQAMATKGCLDEIIAKAKLQKSRLHNGADEDSVSKSVDQMRSDLDTYSCRLNEIYEELEGYGVFSNIQDMDTSTEESWLN